MTRLIWLVLVGQLGFVVVRDAIASPRVMHDRVDGTSRHLTIVVQTEHGCVPATQLEVVAPFVVSPRTHCAATIVGPSNVSVSIAAENVTYIIDPPAPEIPPVPTTTIAGFSLAVFPRHSVPVGDVVSAAYLVATDRGHPTSNVDFHVTIDGASPRALRWVAPGVAEIDVAVSTWRPDVGLTVEGGGRTASTTVPVDPGPPVDVTIDLPTIRAGEPFAVVASVRTDNGVPVDRQRARIVIAGCAATNAMFRCPAGPKVATVELVIDGQWAPLDERTFDVAPLAAPPAAADKRALGMALRGGRLLHGWAIGARVEGTLDVAPRRRIVATAGWRYMRDSLTRELPLASDPVLAEHEGSVAGGMTWQPWSAPVFVRATGGLAFVHATLGGVGVADLGVRILAEIAAGATRDRYSVALGIRGSRDVVVAGWRGSPIEAFAEVSCALFD